MKEKEPRGNIGPGDLPWIISDIEDLAHPGSALEALLKAYKKGNGDSVSSLHDATNILFYVDLQNASYRPNAIDSASDLEIKKLKQELEGLVGDSSGITILRNPSLGGHAYCCLSCRTPMYEDGAQVGANQVWTYIFTTENGERRDNLWAFSVISGWRNVGRRSRKTLSLVEGFADPEFYENSSVQEAMLVVPLNKY